MSSQTSDTLTCTQTMTARHFVITIQTPRGMLCTRDGLLHVGPDATRAQCLRDVMEPLFAEFGRPIVILFYSLEPNTLAPGAGQ
ncbi:MULTISPECIES: hypothetical protein [Streptomyces]|uniref:hypothetical protein n=1 Tax=Streptomyces TaxID=1883 RepID=UPI00345BB4F2